MARVRNQGIVDLIAAPEDATMDFSSGIGDFQEMTVGWVQAVYSGITDSVGTVELYVSGICDETTMARYATVDMDAACESVGFNIGDIGFRYFQVRYVANGETTGTIDRIIAIGKRG